MRVLAIDDQPEALKQIEKAVSGAKAPDGKPYEVVALTDHKEALERLETDPREGNYFDVVITDMVMGTEEEEGLDILRQLTDKSPITIVLTAHPSIPNCVASMRAGAWDYLEKIPKDGSDPYDNLLRSLEEACRYRMEHPEAGRSSPEARYVRENLSELVQKYGGEVIAILDFQVVDHDESYGELEKRVKEKYPVAHPMLVSIPDLSVEAIE